MALQVGRMVAIVAACLLVLAGLLKLRSPRSIREALETSSLPSGMNLVRALALGEVLAGLSMILIGGAIPTAASSALYACFAAFVIQAVARHLPLRSCGCFGRDDAAPSLIHIAVALVLAVILATVAAAGGSVTLAQLVSSQGLSVLPIVGGLAVVLYDLLGPLPSLLAERSKRSDGTKEPLPVLTVGRLVPRQATSE